MDKSLDEYAKEKRIGMRRGGGGGGGNRRGGRFNNGNNQSTSGRGFNQRRSGGGVQKRNSGGGGGLSPSKANASINGQWRHDLYQDSSRFRRSTSAGAIGSGSGPANLVISNLDFGVTDSDIKGLFAEFGKIRKAAVHYDRTGRSLGTADVLFERKSDAIRALTHYNGVSLDGRPMNIQLTTSLSALGNGNGGRRSFGGNGRRGGSGGRGGGQRRGGRREQKPTRSAADLDAELDAHNSKMQTD
ncbi:unnamed protein product [Brachionus calyciflorus]|uniref:RRM domain-containing protein n=1 Tax=Brachionus calyciflorus TaxID=104777 RepID=A0A813N7L6_9BILA|nr:unnamed protein product [Brachionus calyciflorus]